MKFKNSFQNSFNLCKISTCNCYFLSTVIFNKLTTIAFTDSFGLVWARNMNNISNES